MSSSPKIDSKQALLDAAKKLFAEKGYEGATVKDLADAAGVNVSLVSYHFGGKEGLYRAVLVQFAQTGVDNIQRILKGPTSASDFKARLRLFGEELLDVHLKEPDLCRIIHRDVEKLTTVGEEIVRTGFFPLFLTFVNFLKTAEKIKITQKFKDTEQVASLIMGSLMHFFDKDHVRICSGRPSIRDAKYREEILTLWTNMTVASLGTHPSSSQES